MTRYACLRALLPIRPIHCLIYCKVPDDWVEGVASEPNELWLKGPSLKPDKLERLFESLYGKGMTQQQFGWFTVRRPGIRDASPEPGARAGNAVGSR
jgi:hypothetical protein